MLVLLYRFNYPQVAVNVTVFGFVFRMSLLRFFSSSEFCTTDLFLTITDLFEALRFNICPERNVQHHSLPQAFLSALCTLCSTQSVIRRSYFELLLNLPLKKEILKSTTYILQNFI